MMKPFLGHGSLRVSGAMGFLGRCIESFGAEVVLSIGSNLASKGHISAEKTHGKNGWRFSTF